MHYELPLACVHWLAVKHSFALIMLQMVLVFQTNIDHCTSLTHDKNLLTNFV